MLGRINEEFTQDADGFIVGDVDVGLLTKRLAMDVLETEDQGQCQSQGFMNYDPRSNGMGDRR